jgi:hypothetical protein
MFEDVLWTAWKACDPKPRISALVWQILLYHSKHTKDTIVLSVLFSIKVGLVLNQLSQENKIDEITLGLVPKNYFYVRVLS